MKTLFSSILIIDSIIAFYLFLSPLWVRKKLDNASLALHLFALASAIWSLGFGLLFLQTDTESAYFWHSFAIFGTVMYMIAAQFLIGLFAQLSTRLRRICNLVACSGIVPYLLSIRRDQTEYFMSPLGMTYLFKSGPINAVYTGYFILVSANILMNIVHMIHSSEKKRLRVFGWKFLLVTILILLGTILDMVFPSIGLAALPGSNVTQFLGLIILFYAMNIMNRTQINITNMSEFIYYSLAAPVMVFNEHHHLCLANEAAKDFLSLPKDDRHLNSVHLESLFDLSARSLFTFTGSHHHCTAVCQVNGTSCELTVSKINDDYGDIIGYIVNIQDLSEHMRYIEELKKARQAADSSNDAKSQFLANMSHEIRTPMNAIIGFTELALQETSSPEVTDYLEDIKSASHNLMTLINDILDISKIESGKMALVDVEYRTEEFFHNIREIILTQTAKKHLEFRFEIDPAFPSVLRGDVNRLQSILINLLNNSIKYTPAGFVQLTIGCTSPGVSPFTMEIRVSDSGIGIREEEIPKLFETFTQVDRIKNYGTEGTGLGLSLVKGYSRLMNGDVRVESVYGKGSTFIATVEQTVVDASPLDTNLLLSEHVRDDFSLGTMHVHGVHVLVVDDNPVNCKVISRCMRYYGLHVDVASVGSEAIEMCKKKLYDLVFMDQMMPEMDGLEAMGRIRQINGHYAKSGHCKIIVLTANAIAGVREELLDSGFDEYLSKPLDFRHLDAILLKFLPPEVFEEKKTNAKAPADASSLTVLLPSVNVTEGILHCGGTVKDYLEVLEIMYNASAQQLFDLERAYEQSDWENFAVYAHALKGSCLNIGANDCANAAKTLELAGRAVQTDIICAQLEPFLTQYRGLMQEILRTTAAHESSHEKSSGAGAESCRSILDQLKEAIAAFDFAQAGSLFQKAQAAPDAGDYADLLTRLSAYMDELDVDAILALLGETMG